MNNEVCEGIFVSRKSLKKKKVFLVGGISNSDS